MKNWSAIAAASELDIPAADVERIVKPLNGLEEIFRPLANTLAFADEPATTFEATEDGE
jgi:hypothetical protein